MIFVYLALVILAFGGLKEIISAVYSRKKYSMSAKESKELSWASKQIIVAYNNLPEDHRPYANLHDMLEAMDTKYIKRNVDYHFLNYDEYAWDGCRCYHGECEYGEYKTLYNNITAITDALQEQEHALEIERVRGRLGAVQELTERLRQERELIDSVTKELTE